MRTRRSLATVISSAGKSPKYNEIIASALVTVGLPTVILPYVGWLVYCVRFGGCAVDGTCFHADLPSYWVLFTASFFYVALGVLVYLAVSFVEAHFNNNNGVYGAWCSETKLQ